MFVNRQSELNLLENRYASKKAEFFVLYGRRRVGKTELLLRFCEDKRTIFFVADLGSESTLRASLSAIVNRTIFGMEQMNAVYASWDDLFQTIAKGAKSERIIVVLDEFPYLVAAHSPLPTILQRIWDQSLKHSLVMLILCGSYIGMMEETVLGYQAPLYGRRTGQYLLEPLLFQNAREFYLEFSPVDQVRTYAVYGGTPAYLQSLDPEASLSDNILTGILSRGAFLYDEVRFLLQQELREPRNYFAILQAIAADNTRLNEIKQASRVEGVSAYLDVLQQLHLIERIVPITETQPHKSRRGIYRIKDHYLRFWFRFVHPNRSQLESGGGKTILERNILPHLDRYSGFVFEEICQQFLWMTADAGNLPIPIEKVGSWWNRNEEVDIVALAEKEAILGECKWSTKPVGIDIYENLLRKGDLVRSELGNKNLWYALFSRSGFTDSLKDSVRDKNILLYDLETII
jgi:uncharacterized protein